MTLFVLAALCALAGCVMKASAKRRPFSDRWFRETDRREWQQGFESVRWQADKINRETWKAGR